MMQRRLPMGPGLTSRGGPIVATHPAPSSSAASSASAAGVSTSAQPASSSSFNNTKLPRDKQEEQWRIHHTLLLQSTLLLCRHQSSFEAQQTKALHDLNLVSQELFSLRKELAIQILQKRRKEHTLKLDRILQQQVRIYQEISPLLDIFEQQYYQMTQAVGKAVFRVGLVDVEVDSMNSQQQQQQQQAPSSSRFHSSSSSKYSVQTGLNLASRQLTRVNELLSPHITLFQSLHTQSTALRTTIENEAAELASLHDAVQKAHQLESMERGLRIEEIQTRKEDLKRALLKQQDQWQPTY